jgi:Fur family peroxide stress response transcriptional regulator
MNPSKLLSDAKIVEALRRRGYKATPQRIAICRFVLHSRAHPTAQETYREVRQTYPTVSLATVYKTLSALSELGLVQQLPLGHGEARFDSYVEPHVNLVCRRCGNISDLEHRLAREIVAKVAAATDFTLTGQRLDMYGICQKCSRKS